MAKDKSKKKGKKAAPDAHADELKLGKKQRKALEEREAAIAAELAARSEKPKKDKGSKKKGKLKTKPVNDAPHPKSKEEREAARPVTPEAQQGEASETELPAGQVLAAADKVLADPNASEGAIKSARAARSKALERMSPAELKTRVQDKAATRQALIDSADDIDRDDEAAVKAYNAQLADLGGGTFLTSTAERAKNDAGLTVNDEAAGLAAVIPNSEVEKPAKRKAKADELVVEIGGETLAAPEHVAEVVATEQGDIIAVGPASTPDDLEPAFAQPSDAPKQLEENGNRQYKIKRPSDGKTVGYTRVTTYIDNLESKDALEKWKLRLLLEGVSLDDTNEIIPAVRDLVHNRDLAIAKAQKADRKGKLDVGELGTIVEGAWSDFKRGLGVLAEKALDIAGQHDKASKGTDLHALTELHDTQGIDAVGELVNEGKATPADLADIEAYARALASAGIKVLELETVVANHDLKVAGRLDRVVMVKLPGSSRAIRVVADIKTGRIDYSAGKIAQQITMYATAERYDLETGESSKLGASLTKGLLIHLPAGKAECHIYVVDLSTGRVGNDLSGKVRAWRNDGKRAIDLTVDLALPQPPAE